MNVIKLSAASADQIQLSRRFVLRAGVAATLAAVLGFRATPSATAAVLGESAPAAAFLRASEFLTHRTLDPLLAARYYAGLKKRNAKLDGAITQLLARVAQSKAVDIDAFLAQGAGDKATMATVSEVISAWYLGIVGDGADSELVSYADALMYQPTRGVLVVPSYGGGPNSWGEKPV